MAIEDVFLGNKLLESSATAKIYNMYSTAVFNKLKLRVQKSGEIENLTLTGGTTTLWMTSYTYIGVRMPIEVYVHVPFYSKIIALQSSHGLHFP